MDENKDYYFFNGSIDNLNSDHTFENHTQDFKHFEQKFIVSPDTEKIFVSNYISDGGIRITNLQCKECANFSSGDTVFDLDRCVLAYPFVRQVYLIPRSHEEHQFQYFFSDVYKEFDFGIFSIYNNVKLDVVKDYRLFRTPFFTATSTQVLESHQAPTVNKKWASLFNTYTGDKVISGLTPVFFTGMFINFEKKLNILTSTGAGICNLFPTMTGDYVYYIDKKLHVHQGTEIIGDFLYPYSDDGLTSLENYLTGLIPKQNYSLEEMGEYTVRGNSPFMFGSIEGNCNITANIRTNTGLKNPPYIRNLILTSNNEMSNTFIQGQDNRIIIRTNRYI